ncbi:MAG: PAS domain-containing protein [Methylomonas sp.]|nr:PAS domain-containing protein [Methylomonas sp.]PPD21591.1 MAG: aerotaxis receptor Aer [Methylomonas sp.]PPD23455.1 MAG: aerotaxis receptor Aer [Methylomonas sp.]PPD30181.1 MAG: aerotaxis receptor Aer [Methylomonas sp.]PPD37814.1 MAG: aerotaxis receptor Aer [Methylomonas sp.]
MKPSITPSQNEKKLADEDFIVSKTDATGRITYANRIFMDIAGYPESSLLGVQHNVIRHPDMPRGVFRFMWNTLKAGNEFFGFAKNLCADGSYYWVFANITQDYDKAGKLQGYYSVRRQPPRSALDVIEPIYREMLSIERQSSSKEAADKSLDYLTDVVRQTGAKSYDSLVLNLYKPNGVL